ncbi:MAG: hypothetical protein B7L53_10000, partial [Thermofilum sp. NZ13]
PGRPTPADLESAPFDLARAPPLLEHFLNQGGLKTLQPRSGCRELGVKAQESLILVVGTDNVMGSLTFQGLLVEHLKRV